MNRFHQWLLSIPATTPAQRVQWLRYIATTAGVIAFFAPYFGLPAEYHQIANGVAVAASLLIGKPIVEVVQQALRMPESTPPPQTVPEVAQTIGEGE